MHNLDTEEVEVTILEFREGSSDKMYIAKLLKQSDDTYRVLFMYGKRHNVNNTSFKPSRSEPGLSYGEGVGIYQQTIDKKLKKGYTKVN